MAAAAQGWGTNDEPITHAGGWGAGDEPIGSNEPKPSATISDKIGAFFHGAATAPILHPIDVLTSAASLIRHPVDTINSIEASKDQLIAKAAHAFASGDVGQGMIHTLLSMIPLVGPGVDAQYQEMRDAENRGDEAGMAHAAGKLFGVAASAELARRAPDSIELAKKAARAATTPTALKAGGALAGAAAGHATGIPYASAAGAYVGKQLGEALSDKINAPPEAIPSTETLSRLGMTPESFKGLEPDMQAEVRNLTTRMENPTGYKPPDPNFQPSVGTPEFAEQLAKERAQPQTSMGDMIDREIQARKGSVLKEAESTVPIEERMAAVRKANADYAAQQGAAPPADEFIRDEHGNPLMKKGTEPTGVAATIQPPVPAAPPAEPFPLVKAVENLKSLVQPPTSKVVETPAISPEFAPSKLMTEEGLTQYMRDHGLTEEEARPMLTNEGYTIMGRGQINRALHGIAAELGIGHPVLSDIASQTYGVKSMTQMSQEDLLGMYDDLQNKRSISEPLMKKSQPVSVKDMMTTPKALANNPEALAAAKALLEALSRK